MDAAQYWMLMKRKEIFVKRQYYLNMKTKSSDHSWEEKAFAEDISIARGCIWPPKCYSCSFCKREFNSAQALGGHMNVHRRDRARLKHQQHSNNDSIKPSDDQSRVSAPTCAVQKQCKLSSFVSSSQKLPQAAEKILCENDDDVETKLSIGLRFVRPSMSCGGDEVMISSKRAKTAEDNVPDLELRLGNYLPTTVKLEELLKF